MHLTSSLEILEARIAPAALATLTVVGTKATYKDVDGDTVSIVIAGGTTPVTTGLFSGVAGALGDQLQTIDLSGGSFDHASITVTVKRAITTGDGLANIGYVNSTGHDLGAVSILGDLGQIDAGDTNTAVTSPAIKSLKVNSLGHRGIDTQGGSASLESDLIGGLGSLTVTHDLDGAFLKVSGAMAGTDDAAGTIGPIKIGGSLIGRAADDSGELKTSGKMGAVTITEDLAGGSGNRSGMLNSGSAIGAITIGGSIFGGNLAGSDSFSGAILSVGDIGAVKVTHDVVFGSGSKSAYLQAGGLAPGALGKLTSLTIGGSLIGNSVFGGTVESANNMGPVKIGGSVLGGLINSFGTMGTVSITGSLVGGSFTNSGVVSSVSNMGLVTIGHDIQGTSNTQDSGEVLSLGNIAGVKVGGSIIGGPANLTVTASYDGGIYAAGNLGPVTIAHDLIGGKNSTTTTTINGVMFLPRDLHDSGYIEAGGRITSVVISGSIYAGGNFGTGTVERSGAITAGDDIGSLTVTGSIVGNRGNGGSNVPVFISARGQAVPKTGVDLAIGKITIGHRVENAQILAGYSSNFSKVDNADAQIGPVTVNGAWIASSLVAGAQNLGANHGSASDDNVNFGNADDALYTTHDTATVAKIASITIKGTVSGTLDSISSTDHFGFVAQAFGTVKINGVTVVTPAMAPGLLDIGETNDVSVHRLA